jgi:hypothetical protein
VAFLRSFLAFWYDFVVGDDWVVAVGVIGLLLVSGVLAHAGVTPAAWVILPVGVLAVLVLSVRRAIAH